MTQKSGSAKQNVKPAKAESNLPLFFISPNVLDPERHAEAGITGDVTFDFARKTNAIPIMLSEFIEAAKIYPIAFTPGKDPMPIAIVGLEQQNHFVDKEGAWAKDCYIPAYVRKYPFVLLEIPEEQKLVLCIDEGSPHFSKEAKDKRAIRLFENGEATKWTKEAMNFCLAIQQDHMLTRKFCERLTELDLLTANHADVTLPNGRQVVLGGFQLIDPERFAKLSDLQVLDLHREGFLAFITYVVMAKTNWNRLLSLAAAAE